MMEFTWPIRVYYEDTDAAGVVYHSNYLKYMERARTEWLRKLGFSQEVLREETGNIIVVSEMDIKFVRPAKLDDMLEVNSVLIKVTGASFLFEQSIQKMQEKICSARVKGVCLNALTFKPQRLPAALKSELSHVN
ncbi:MAG: tol-pal system-associated acyl-CoA thioesterase [Gammaproteobacteria bacterium]|jgi:acyl-CoA thioester hydrolase|nr:tol-pal system-associated acyl-CoA thioesterase [Gammaproteobacteria bacterium]